MSGLERASSPPPDLDRAISPGRAEPAPSSRREPPARFPDTRSDGFASALEAARARESARGGSDRRSSRADGTGTAPNGETSDEETGEFGGQGPTPSELPAGTRPPALTGGSGTSDTGVVDTGSRDSAGGVIGLSASAPPSAASGEVFAPAASAGAIGPALDVAAIGTLMSDLRALDAPPSAQWRFSMPGNADGLNSLVLSRGEGGAWNLKLGTERGRGISRVELDSLRGALRERGHEVGRISHGADDGDGVA